MFRCNTPTHLLAWYADLPSLAATGVLHYSYVIAIFKHPEGSISGLITLERSDSMQNAFCIFDENGRHHNFGDLPDLSASDMAKAFLSGAGMILRDKYGIADGNWMPVEMPLNS
jgi:hypothetical protein